MMKSSMKKLLQPCKASRITSFKPPSFTTFRASKIQRRTHLLGSVRLNLTVEEQHESPNEQRNFAVNLLKMPSPTAELKESQNMLRMRSPSGGVQVNIDLTIQKKTRASAQSRGMTIPKPFNLATAVKKAIQSGEMEPKSPFVPLAQKIRTFETATPERFKTKPKASKRIAQMQKLTQPQSPMLSTKLRSQHRYLSILSEGPMRK